MSVSVQQILGFLRAVAPQELALDGITSACSSMRVSPWTVC